MTHIKLNFGYYYTELLLQQADSEKNYLVCYEQMAQDLNFINYMMGDRNANLFENQHTSFSHWIDGTNSKTDLPVSGYETISKEGYKHLCKVPCPELQIYKQLFVRALNMPINWKDALDMMTSLRSKCPTEADLDDCPEQFPTLIP